MNNLTIHFKGKEFRSVGYGTPQKGQYFLVSNAVNEGIYQLDCDWPLEIECQFTIVEPVRREDHD